ncbi:WG repeat-containing protein [bacterium]|nr:WG repeat-containing protein [bacterium]
MEMTAEQIIINAKIEAASILMNTINILEEQETRSVNSIEKFKEINREVVKNNTEKMEESSLPHSVFDYKHTFFFTNGKNKRFFSVQSKTNGKYGLFNARGEMIVPCIYDFLGHFVSGECEFIDIVKDNKHGLIDCLGNLVVEPISDIPVFFYDGLALIKQNNKFGFINTSGNIVLPAIYDKASNFLFGEAEVETDNEKFYINRKGEKIEPINIRIPKEKSLL